MKRGLELWRAILLKVEELSPGQDIRFPLKIDGYDDEAIAEHVRLLSEANFIEAHLSAFRNRIGGLQVRAYTIARLLNDGHDFIANAKNPIIWKKTREFISSKSGDVSLAVIKGVLTKITSEHLGL